MRSGVGVSLIPRGRSPSRRLPQLPHRGAWFTRPGVRARIEADAARVAAAYPGLTLVLDEGAESAALVGTILLREEVSGVPTPVQVRIVLRPGYPRTEPYAYETGGLFDQSTLDGHVIHGGRLCLWLPPRSQWQGSDTTAGWSWRDDDALVRFVDQVVLFADRHLIWQVTKRWPGGESAHGQDGWLEYVQERLACARQDLKAFAPAFGRADEIAPYAPCPCGSGAKYRFCHQAGVRRLRRECPNLASGEFRGLMQSQ